MNRDLLVAQIEDAFKDVSLCNGIGIFEADAVDDYASEEVRINERNRDIRDDWKSISDDVIDQHYSVLSFMDEDGLRFSIPAYMRFAVRFYETSASASIDSIIYLFASQRDWKFLSNKQMKVIASFLSYMVLEADDYIDSYQASLAYEKTWSQFEI